MLSYYAHKNGTKRRAESKQKVSVPYQLTVIIHSVSTGIVVVQRQLQTTLHSITV